MRFPPQRKTALAAVVCAALAWTAGSARAAEPDEHGAPAVKLVLQITVDQLRGDVPLRHYERLGEGGLKRLIDEGALFTNAEFVAATTETIVGHATLATGAEPRVHGMVANVWYDRTLDRPVYNIEDPAYEPIGAGASRFELAPAGPGAVARSKGRSPSALESATLSDEMLAQFGVASRAFAVSIKDRSAVPMAGKGGKAFWLDRNSGHFVSSTYYYAALPAWARAFNSSGRYGAYAGKTWSLSQPRERYAYRGADERPFEMSIPVFGTAFPHTYPGADTPQYPLTVIGSPAGDELTVDFAIELLAAEKLGQGSAPDFLAVSLSCTDYVGHFFGPSSLEAEDNILRLDRSLARLLAAVDERVGLDATLIALSADHGVAEAPEARTAMGFPARRTNIDALRPAGIGPEVAKRFDGAALVKSYTPPYIILDHQLARARGIDIATAQREVAKIAAAIPGVHTAVPSVDMDASRRPDDPLLASVYAGHYRERAGDVYVVIEPYGLPYSGEGMRGLAATHGTPWKPDRSVPVLFFGPGVKPGRFDTRAHPRDVVPTLAGLLGIDAPPQATGRPLVRATP